jgi:Fic family protein
MEYITVKQAAEKWNISERRVRLLCAQGKINGTIRKGRAYLVPSDALKPLDGRVAGRKIISERYSDLFYSIDLIKAELDRRRPFTRGELKRIYDEVLVEFTYNSNAIEGNTLTLKETALALEGATIGEKPLKDHLEAIGHKDAFLYITELVSEKIPISEWVIRNIHSLVLIDKPNDKGVYRRMPVKISGAFHEPPQPYLVSKKMEDLVAGYESDKKHAIEKAALFHLNFEGIHPFIDGNGRTGRLLLNLTLMREGYPPVNVKFTDRKKYYDCFEFFFRDGDASHMVELVAGYIKERLTQTLRVLQNCGC